MPKKGIQRGKREGRKTRERETQPNAFLIVTEGTQTEPNYFGGLRTYINGKYRARRGIDVRQPSITVEGKGRSTVKLVQEAMRLAAAGNVMYSQVWVVFDRDEFADFDEAIALAKENDIHVAWSNQSFEYWIYLHFGYIEAALGREDWVKKTSELFVRERINPKGYGKSDEHIFEIVMTHGSLKKAMENATRIERRYPENAPPSQCDPCTKVHRLIHELEPYIPELLEG